MKKLSLRLAATSLMLCASFAASAGTLVTKTLEITGVVQEVVGPSLRCPSKIGGTIVGHGDSALVGKVAFIGSDCITPSGVLYNFSNGRIIIMTQTGEQIYANYSGQFVPTGEGTKFVFSNATFQITGGTGKYFRATGGGGFTGGEDMATGAGTIKLTGRVTYKQ
ncbi:hypothetical protein [Massilia yuzhufengensis]|uniref:Uncharacterized protein n=1 Tax=Massilia yuzhufengensis TaxID=1164594 RepID=A0A1I1TLQ0_9BURK|nr:hypothetical protein [Massilia yuzhufengensis]SFD59572.1 hypothetical protein SAMN05216204_12953 [Massilia yuzhufengensis]